MATQPENVQVMALFNTLSQYRPQEEAMSLDATSQKYTIDQINDAIKAQDVDESGLEAALKVLKEHNYIREVRGMYALTHVSMAYVHGMQIEPEPSEKSPLDVQVFKIYESLTSKFASTASNSLDKTKIIFSRQKVDAAIGEQGKKDFENIRIALVNNGYLKMEGDGYSPTHRGLTIYHGRMAN